LLKSKSKFPVKGQACCRQWPSVAKNCKYGEKTLNLKKNPSIFVVNISNWMTITVF